MFVCVRPGRVGGGQTADWKGEGQVQVGLFLPLYLQGEPIKAVNMMRSR